MARTRYRIFPNDLTPYFLTLTAVGFLPLFSDPGVAQILLDSLRFLTTTGRIKLYAYVIMENHLHLIISALGLGKEVARFKSYTARKSIDYFTDAKYSGVLSQLARYKAHHKTDRSYQFWQEGSFPKQIQSEEMMRQKIEYIHYNPVRRGYVDVPEHWRYSSARNYADLHGLVEVCKDW